MKYYSTKVTLKHPWEQVVSAFWQRYPNPHAKHVLSEDIVFRKLTDNLILKTKRFLTKTNPMPKWGRKIVNVKDVGVIEESSLDPKAKTLVTYTRNVGMMHVMSVDERVLYRPDPDNPNCTEVHREAWISSSMRGVSMLIMQFGYERFKHNAGNATKGFLHVLSRLYPHHPLEAHQKLTGKVITELVAKKLDKKVKELTTSGEVL